MSYTLKIGSTSIVLGDYYYGKVITPRKDKLLKVSKVLRNHNEFKHLSIIRTIENYTNYFSIPEDDTYIVNPEDKIYKEIKNLVSNERTNIFLGPLIYSFIDNAGDKELLDTIISMNTNYDFSFWKSYKTIINFSKQIMESLNFLHEKNICHLDIKPENIMVNTKTRQFRIIDFGFACVEPFQDYIDNIRGTPGYFPKFFPHDKVESWLPRIDALDLIKVNNKIPMQNDYMLVYKIDSYCLGRVIYFIKSCYKENVVYTCFNLEKLDDKKLDEIINSLIEKDPIKRLTIKECLNKYF